MHWEQSGPDDEHAVPDTVVDAVFGVCGHALPVDHAYALSQAIERSLPWFREEPIAGLHLIHGAESGNGWVRPADPRSILYLSRRTKLALRIPRQRVADASSLVGQTLDVGGFDLGVERIALRPLSRITTLFSRYVAIAENHDESDFLNAAASELEELGVRPRKMLCGLTTSISIPFRDLKACSLMLAGLTIGESMLLQQRGLGPHRRLGCGLFLPHKDIEDVRSRLE